MWVSRRRLAGGDAVDGRDLGYTEEASVKREVPREARCLFGILLAELFHYLLRLRTLRSFKDLLAIATVSHACVFGNAGRRGDLANYGCSVGVSDQNNTGEGFGRSAFCELNSGVRTRRAFGRAMQIPAARRAGPDLRRKTRFVAPKS